MKSPRRNERNACSAIHHQRIIQSTVEERVEGESRDSLCNHLRELQVHQVKMAESGGLCVEGHQLELHQFIFGLCHISTAHPRSPSVQMGNASFVGRMCFRIYFGVCVVILVRLREKPEKIKHKKGGSTADSTVLAGRISHLWSLHTSSPDCNTLS